MSKKSKLQITEELSNIFGDSITVLKIDSALLAPSHRRRLYWTNLPNVSIPNPSGKKFHEVLVNGYVDKEKANVLLSSNVTATNGIFRYYNMNIGNIIFKSEQFAKLPTEQKLSLYPSILKDSGYNGRERGFCDEYEFPNGCYRVPSVLERERLMTFPDGYVSDVPNVSRTEKNKILGLSFTVDVISEILSNIDRLEMCK